MDDWILTTRLLDEDKIYSVRSLHTVKLDGCKREILSLYGENWLYNLKIYLVFNAHSDKLGSLTQWNFY